jgi:hypothetical protein
MQVDELLHEDGQLVGASLGVAPVNGKILSLDISQVLKLFAKSLEFGKVGSLGPRARRSAAWAPVAARTPRAATQPPRRRTG